MVQTHPSQTPKHRGTNCSQLLVQSRGRSWYLSPEMRDAMGHLMGWRWARGLKLPCKDIRDGAKPGETTARDNIVQGSGGGCLGAWFSSGLGNAALMVGLHDLKGLVQPKPFYDSDDSKEAITESFIYQHNQDWAVGHLPYLSGVQSFG